MFQLSVQDIHPGQQAGNRRGHPAGRPPRWSAPATWPMAT